MVINKINQSINREFHVQAVEHRDAVPLINHNDFKRDALRNDLQLQQMLKKANETILEIRQISNNRYLIITNGGHEIPIKIIGIPYGRGQHFGSLDWNGGEFYMYIDMG